VRRLEVKSPKALASRYLKRQLSELAAHRDRRAMGREIFREYGKLALCKLSQKY